MKWMSLKAGFECLEARHCLSATLNLTLAGEADSIVEPELFDETPINSAEYSTEAISNLDAGIPSAFDFYNEAALTHPVSVHEDFNLGFIEANSYEAVVSDSLFPSDNLDPFNTGSAFEASEQIEVYFEVSSRPEFWLINDFGTFEYYSSFSFQHVIFVSTVPNDTGNTGHSLQPKTAQRTSNPLREQPIPIQTSVENAAAATPIVEDSGSLQEIPNRTHPESTVHHLAFASQQPRVAIQPSASSGIIFATTDVTRYRSVQSFDQIGIDPSKVHLEVNEIIQGKADSTPISAIQSTSGSADPVQSDMQHVAVTLAQTSARELLDFAKLAANGPFGSRILEFTNDHVESVFEITSIDSSAPRISSVARMLAMVSNHPETSDEEVLYSVVASAVIGGISLFAFHRNRKQTTHERQQIDSPIQQSSMR